jgi:Flp pilus assembly protein TadG
VIHAHVQTFVSRLTESRKGAGMNSRNRERGLTVPMLALFIVVLLVMAALAIDMGLLYTARTSAQHAADAAALAGAYTFVTNPTASAADASAAAKTSGTGNSILGTPVAPAEVQVTQVLTPSSTQPGRVTVSITRNIATSFARVIGVNQQAVTVIATAEASTLAGGTTCLRPFWITNSQNGSCSNPLIMPDGTPNPSINLTNYPIALHDNTTPSQWGFIDFGSGAASINASVAGCQNVRISCAAPLTVETGNISSIQQPMQNLIGQPQQDTFIAPGQYRSTTGTISDMSTSLVTVAILDNCNGQGIPSSGSHATIDVAAFADVFIDNVDFSGSNKTINGHLVNYRSCGGVGNQGSGGTGPYAIPVRLVQPQ